MAKGNTYAEFWLRKTIPASGKPTGPRGAVLYPILAEGELLGALRFPGEGHDYRDQTIAQGVYTLRYGLQPVNGDHLGVSPFRDYAPAAARGQGHGAGAPGSEGAGVGQRRSGRDEPSGRADADRAPGIGVDDRADDGP